MRAGGPLSSFVSVRGDLRLTADGLIDVLLAGPGLGRGWVRIPIENVMEIIILCLLAVSTITPD